MSLESRAYHVPATLSASAKVGVAGFIDVETTGLSPATEEIVELALVVFSFDWKQGAIMRVLDQYVGLRQPSKPIPPDAVRIHGITDDAVRGQRLDEVRVIKLLDACEFLVAHNAGFDRGFVTRLFPMAAQKPWMCSMRDIDWYGKGHTSRGLQSLLAAHRIDAGQAHRGEDDAKAALELLAHKGPARTPYFTELLQRYIARHLQTPERTSG